MAKKVFISGPIIGMEKQQDYRKTITDITKTGMETIDPQTGALSITALRTAGGTKCPFSILSNATSTMPTDATSW
jgi:hypothetical protein